MKTGGASTWWRFQPQPQVSLHYTPPLWLHLQFAGSSLRRLLGGMREVTGSVPRTRHIVVALPADPASNYAEGRAGWFSFLSSTLPACSTLSRLIRSCSVICRVLLSTGLDTAEAVETRHTHTLSLCLLLLCASCWVGEGAKMQTPEGLGVLGKVGGRLQQQQRDLEEEARRSRTCAGPWGLRAQCSGLAQPLPAASLAPAPWSLLIPPRGTDVEVKPGETCPALTRVRTLSLHPFSVCLLCVSPLHTVKIARTAS